MPIKSKGMAENKLVSGIGNGSARNKPRIATITPSNRCNKGWWVKKVRRGRTNPFFSLKK